jgi:O-antigen ligase
MYLAPHNSLIQVSSECGIPAALLFIAATYSTWRRLSKTFREARQRQDSIDIRVAALCIMIAVLGFSVAAFFLSLAYTFYLPAMAGLAVALSNAATAEFKRRDGLAATPAPRVPPFSQFPRPVGRIPATTMHRV